MIQKRILHAECETALETHCYCRIIPNQLYMGIHKNIPDWKSEEGSRFVYGKLAMKSRAFACQITPL